MNSVCITLVRDTLSFNPPPPELSLLRAFMVTVDAETARAIVGGAARTDSTWSLRPCALSGRVAVSLAMPFCDSSVCGRHWGRSDDTPVTISIRGVFRSQLRSTPPCPPPQTTRSATRTTTPGHCTLTATCPTRCTVHIALLKNNRLTDMGGRGWIAEYMYTYIIKK